MAWCRQATSHYVGQCWPKSMSSYSVTISWLNDAEWSIYMSQWNRPSMFQITHWGRVTHICVSKLTIIGSDNGLSPDRRQAIIWTNAGLLLIGPLGTNLIEILIEIRTFSFKKMHLKVSSAKRQPFCLGLNVIMACHLFSPKLLSEAMLCYS